MAEILVDHSEPDDIINLMRQSVEVVCNPLNESGLSDYYFAGCDFRTRQYSRKQAGELLSDIDEAERQLGKYYPNADENYQVVEGIITSIPLSRHPVKIFDISQGITTKTVPLTNILYSYKVAPNGHIFDEHPHKVRPGYLHNWLFQLSQCGVITFFTMNYMETAQMLVHHFQSANSTEAHLTLQRYIRPKIDFRHLDPFIAALMSLSAAYKLDIGETKATAIRDAGFKTILDLAMSSSSELQQIPGIGKTIADKLMAAIGRKTSV